MQVCMPTWTTHQPPPACRNQHRQHKKQAHCKRSARGVTFGMRLLPQTQVARGRRMQGTCSAGRADGKRQHVQQLLLPTSPLARWWVPQGSQAPAT